MECPCCIVCTDDYTELNEDSCECDEVIFVKELLHCIPCPEGCPECSFNYKTNKSGCLYCYYDCFMNSKNECVCCDEDCEICSLDPKNDSHTLYSSCYPGYTLYDNVCIECPEGCSDCSVIEFSEYENKTICNNCSSNYALTPSNSCISCQSISNIVGDTC